MYEMKQQVTYSQVGSDLKVGMSGIAQYFQDCTIFHSEALGKGLKEVEVSHHAWFLSGWQIKALRYPEFKEEITVRTWPYDFKGIYGYRNFDIVDGTGRQIVRANSIWIFMDLENMRPSKPSEEDLAGYEMEEAIKMDYAPRKIKILDEEYRVQTEEAYPVIVKKSFLDSNQHVNNGRYVVEALDLLPEEKEIKEMRVDYRKAATLGEQMYPSLYRKENICQTVFSDKEGNPFVVVEVLG
ncbi:MAG: thioesterase [Bacteroidales bacterium]|nr:thioesterase [Clostridium sp.]MCM1204187.1 thioesterase [Bacteroidales bacterium]